MSPLLWSLLVGFAILVVFVIVQYNKLMGLRLRIRESWANVDTELKRRHDLIPNLLEAVKGYAAHERQLLTEVTRLRGEALAEARDSLRRRTAERQLAVAVGSLLGVAEAYPQLRASESFLKLQDQLAETEDRIQASRRFYNANVRDYNNQVQQFPSNLVAKSFRFRVHEYFELPNLSERQAVPVSF